MIDAAPAQAPSRFALVPFIASLVAMAIDAYVACVWMPTQEQAFRDAGVALPEMTVAAIGAARALKGGAVLLFPAAVVAAAVVARSRTRARGLALWLATLVLLLAAGWAWLGVSYALLEQQKQLSQAPLGRWADGPA
jgi:hypothetical protein